MGKLQETMSDIQIPWGRRRSDLVHFVFVLSRLNSVANALRARLLSTAIPLETLYVNSVASKRISAG